MVGRFKRPGTGPGVGYRSYYYSQPSIPIHTYGCVYAYVCVRACVCVYKDNSMDRTGLRAGTSGEGRRLAPQYGT